MSARVQVRSGRVTARAAARFAEALGAVEPDLVAGFQRHLPAAAEVVTGRVVGAAYREGLVAPEVSWHDQTAFLPVADGGFLVSRARRHGFGRIEVFDAGGIDPAVALERLAAGARGRPGVAAEIVDSCLNLALAYARREHLDADLVRHAAAGGAVDVLALAGGTDADSDCRRFEQLAVEGHNLHPCGRTRLGWTVPDLLAHDLESEVTEVGFVGVRRDLHVGDEVGADLVEAPQLDPARYAITPVHAWQLDRVVRHRYADLIADGALVPLAATCPAQPTAALRTVLLGPAVIRYLKLSLDVQITSTRRSISVASTRNGPVLSRLLTDAFEADGTAGRVLLMTEPAGSAGVADGGRSRDLSAIARRGLAGRLEPGEIPVPGSALGARSPLSGLPVVAELVNRFAATRVLPPTAAALPFVEAYARLLLEPVLTLATRHGIGLEAHLQNCVPTFVGGMPYRLGLRDLAGLRVYPQRLAHPVSLWPGSAVVTDNVDLMRAKVAYTALQANLAEIVIRLAGSHNLDERAAWARVRSVVDEIFDGLRADPAVAARARADHAHLTAPTVPHKALLSMRLASAAGRDGDIYVPVRNALQ